ncbi:alpha/beta-hydrolase [Dendrothele bispora CBS 962.96]|uniref:Carboxylic ester hydrolase n=1 Tax=Dendrothele bispora (strain CBS 962.96) TaxID=1314807 RepID=A0A4S8MR72_DENBC|nr:alpha/beta-hydrolase [Dendrothele bispora CBS 962.96]
MARLTVALLLAASVLNSYAQSDAPIVDLGYATYQGSFDPTTNVTNFFGLRFALPPTGDLRFQAPQPPANVSGVQQADTMPPECLQAGNGQSPTNPFSNQTVKRQGRQQSDDCLFLNVHIPGSTVPEESLTTVVWIHGGGYIAGSASDFPGSDLINESDRQVVVVTIQYRLGLFGFLAGQEVKDNGALNAGLLDQDFALRWVQAHISKFGGDPTRVAIWGESAGAGSVLQQVVAHDGQTDPPLFRAAMTSSTFLPSQYQFNDPIPEALFSQVVAQTNCSSSSDSLACLRAVDVNTLQNANVAINRAGFFGTFVTVPVVDGTFITQRVIESLQQGKVNGQAILAMTNTNEGISFVNQTAPANATVYAEQLFPNFGLEQDEEVARVYADVGTPLDQVNRIQGESIFICPSYFLLSAFPGKSFKGQFALPPALHGMDVAYYFPSNSPPSFQNADFLKAFSQAFLAFAINLDPNDKLDSGNITPQWSTFSVNNTEMLFNRTEDSSAAVIHTFSTDQDLLDRCSFWEGVGELTGQ